MNLENISLKSDESIEVDICIFARKFIMPRFNKSQRSWAFYDWANSVYNLVITATIFPIYYTAVTSKDGGETIVFLGKEFINTALYSYAVSFSFLVIAIISPLLSGIADYSGLKKRFMKFFTYMGATACAALFFFDANSLTLGILAFVLASIGYSGSLVFYNSYLPEIAKPNEQDRLSARGFAMGYIGSVILLLFNLSMILKPELYGITESSTGPKIAFLTVGLWWAGFAQYPFRHLPANSQRKKITSDILFNGYRELLRIFKNLVEHPQLKKFLTAFFFYTMSVQTVMYIATLFGKKELQLESSQLIITILLIQIVAVGGAFLLARISKLLGNVNALTIAILFWIIICVIAYFTKTATQFYLLAVMVGLVMGGIQALSRSTYSKLLPQTGEHASYFSFYDVLEKLAIVLGTFTYGYIEEITGTMRNSILFFIVFFVLGMMFLRRVKLKH